MKFMKFINNLINGHMKMNHENLMFDIETLGHRESAVILSLACIPFSFNNLKKFSEYLDTGFFVKFSVMEQMKKYNRTISKDTIAWWEKQTPEAKQLSLPPKETDMTLMDGFVALSKFIHERTCYNKYDSFVISRGCHFDFPIITHAYEESLRFSVPFNVFKIRDLRSFVDILTGGNSGFYPSQLVFDGDTTIVKHNPLHDAAYDIYMCTKLIQSLIN